MKRTIFVCLVVLFWNVGSALTVSRELLDKAAVAFIHTHVPESKLRSVDSLLNENGTCVGLLYCFTPSGFIIVSATEKLKPVYAYSFEDSFDSPGGETESLRKLISTDLVNRLLESERYTSFDQAEVCNAWTSFLECFPFPPLFEQWPPEGTTSTGGWLETNWTQHDPYNAMCPMDLYAQTRSLAGCPAVAMAMILNYHREINGTRFNSGDDYYHDWINGNDYMIDDDYLQRGFPCFDTLNLWMDTLEQYFSYSTALTDNLQAALCFACGVSAKQVYSATSSGTFGLDQAVMAYQRFGFTESELLFYEYDSTLASKIAENIKVSLPVHLGLKIEGGSGGHNLVVDGYNTDEFFHFNFGWGGYANGWYTLPPGPEIPYNLTIFKGAVINIKSDIYTQIHTSPAIQNEVLVFPNPSAEELAITGLDGPADLVIYDFTGRIVMTCRVTGDRDKIRISDITTGNYLFHVTKTSSGHRLSGKLVIH